MTTSPYTLEPDIVYKLMADKTELKINIFRPYEAIKAILLYAHGGGFFKGDRHGLAAQKFAEKLCADGVAIASVDYRLLTEISAFSKDKQKLIKKAQIRSIRAGLPINPNLCGPRFYAALEDLSDAITFLRHENGPFSATSVPLIILGVSAGGIAAMSLAFPPMGWEAVSRPDAVIGLCAAMVQPWRLTSEGVPSLMLHGFMDRVISPKCARIIARRAARIKAPLQVVITDICGHNPQVDLFLDGTDENGQPWLGHARRMMQLA